MKRFLLALLTILFIGACDSDTVSTDIIGEWELIEVLADPGDGSGRFTSVNGDKRIRFFEDGAYTSTGSICDFTVEAQGSSNGTYTLSDAGYFIICGESPDYTIGLRIENGFLILTFPCIEPCLQKFRKRN